MCVFPWPFFDTYILSVYSDEYAIYNTNIVVEYLLSDFFLAIMFLRVIFLYRSILNYSLYTDAFTKKLCNEQGFQNNHSFALKCLFNIYPGTLVGGTLTLVITICAYLLRLFEIPLLKHMPASYYTLDAYFNAIYCTIITITTVGYGDIAPKSDLGKVVMMFAALVGALLVSLVVVMVSSSLELSRNQMKVFRQVQAQTAASKVIVKAIKYYQAKKTYYLHKLAKNPSIKEKSWFLQSVKEKKQWQIYINPSYANFSRRRLNEFSKMDERTLIEDMN